MRTEMLLVLRVLFSNTDLRVRSKPRGLYPKEEDSGRPQGKRRDDLNQN
jgi:hypothetical protein